MSERDAHDEIRAALLAAYFRELGINRLDAYRPYGHPDTLWPDGIACPARWTNKPWQLDFHNAGANHPERLILAANGVGKSLAGSWETAAHLTGRYPDWFQGRRFKRPVKWWVGAIDGLAQREGVQAQLVGSDLQENFGTGFIPRECLVGQPAIRNAGVADVIDKISVRHTSGGTSQLTFKTYQQGWRTWQSAAPDGIQLDEEPDENDNKQKDIFSECQTRVFRSGGILYASLTPLLGMTALCEHFMEPQAGGIWYTSAGWDDAPHLKEEDKQRLRKSYPHHQVEARTLGVPMMGEGRIFEASEAMISVKPFTLPRHYARICGIDFGISEDHPFAAAWLAWDREANCVYVTNEYREPNRLPEIHSGALKRQGQWIPIAWPHDGANRDKFSGVPLADHYRSLGLNLLGYSARYAKDKGGPQPLEPILLDENNRMMTNGLKVFSTCHKWFEEFRSYHRRDGRIIRRRDDLMSAMHSAMMMLRYAATEPARVMRTNVGQPVFSLLS